MKAHDAKRKPLNADDLVDRFVEKINASPREPLREDDVPPSLRVGPPGKYGAYDWRMERREDIEWLAPLDARLPGPLPPAFRSLVTRYVYPEFEAGGLWFFANTREQVPNEWRTWLWKDKHLSQCLTASGYTLFARPQGGSYDAICFDTRRQADDGDCPVVWIDHEGILCEHRIVVYKEVAPSFAAWVHEFVAGGKQ